MGFLDKLKSVKNFVTGGGAKVWLEINNPALEEEFTATVKALVGESDLSINRVYLQIKSVEEVVVRDVEVAEEQDGEIRSVRRDISQSNNLFQTELNLAGPADLASNQEYAWEARITLPESALPTFEGRNATHIWYFKAALDARGNDPDSGWVSAEIY